MMMMIIVHPSKALRNGLLTVLCIVDRYVDGDSDKDG